MFNGIACYCIVFHCFVWCCKVLHGIAWYCVVMRIKDLLRKLQFLRKGEQLLWEPIDQRNGNRGALSGLGPTRHPPPPIRSIRSAFTFRGEHKQVLSRKRCSTWQYLICPNTMISNRTSGQCKMSKSDTKCA